MTALYAAVCALCRPERAVFSFLLFILGAESFILQRIYYIIHYVYLCALTIVYQARKENIILKKGLNEKWTTIL